MNPSPPLIRLMITDWPRKCTAIFLFQCYYTDLEHVFYPPTGDPFRPFTGILSLYWEAPKSKYSLCSGTCTLWAIGQKDTLTLKALCVMVKIWHNSNETLSMTIVSLIIGSSLLLSEGKIKWQLLFMPWRQQRGERCLPEADNVTQDQATISPDLLFRCAESLEGLNVF